ncbi:MAG: hypothetical protein ACREB3_02445, partial [Burkholderiales bacterium]
LRYMDNLRRELRRESRPAPSWFHPEALHSLGIGAETVERLPPYIELFGRLPQSQQEIAGCAFAAFNDYLEAQIKTISLIMKGSSKARKRARLEQDAAHEHLVVSGAVLVGSIIDDMAVGRPGFWQWFQDFYSALDRRARLTWSEFGDMLLTDSLALYFAQQVSDEPAQIERLRHLFDVEEWP